MTKKPGKETLNCADKKYTLYIQLLDWQGNPLSAKGAEVGFFDSSTLDFTVESACPGYKPKLLSFKKNGLIIVPNLPPGPVTFRFEGVPDVLETAARNIPFDENEVKRMPPKETDCRQGAAPSEGGSQAEALSAKEGKWYHFHSYRELKDGIQLFVDKENQAPIFQKMISSTGHSKQDIPYWTPHLIELKMLAYKPLKKIIFRERAFNGPGDWGHWWVEIFHKSGDYTPNNLRASFGWWPSNGLFGVASSTRGLLNDSYYDKAEFDEKTAHEGPLRLNPLFDPCATKLMKELDWGAEKIYPPVIEMDDPRTEDEIIDKIFQFSIDYIDSGRNWQWPHNSSKPESSNCHVFIEEMLEHCLIKPYRAEVEKPK